jgi:hypothetical protein
MSNNKRELKENKRFKGFNYVRKKYMFLAEHRKEQKKEYVRGLKSEKRQYEERKEE